MDIQHDSGWGGLLEYNFFPDEAKRDDDRRTNYDWYNNLGTDLYFFGDFKVRNGYLRYVTPAGHWTLRAGRMVNIVGFEEEEVPFWGRVDSPHAHFLTKEILNGVAVAYNRSWMLLEVAALSGQGRPDNDYNWYLEGATDPNTSGNSDVIFEGEAVLRWKEFLSLSVGYHEGETGSAPGDIFSGKHNDDRLLYGLRAQTPALGSYRFRLLLLGQYSDFTFGLTEEGHQGDNTPVESRDLDKHGWFVTGGFSLFERASLYVTHEELDRIDSNIWSNVAQSRSLVFRQRRAQHDHTCRFSAQPLPRFRFRRVVQYRFRCSGCPGLRQVWPCTAGKVLAACSPLQPLSAGGIHLADLPVK